MAPVRIQEAASHRLDEIYQFARSHWGSKQADRYMIGLFEAFDKIETHGTASSPIAAALSRLRGCQRTVLLSRCPCRQEPLAQASA